MKSKSLKDTYLFSKKISKNIKPGSLILLFGEIGVGKTTFARFFINNIQIKEKIKKTEVLSPTFNIVYDYDCKRFKILHYDLYRIRNYKDILELGVFEENNKNILIIEWPEKIKNKPKNRIEIHFKYLKKLDGRNLSIKGFGKFRNFSYK